MKLSIAAESQIIDIFSFSLSAEVGLFGSSILWPVLCSVLCVGEIAPPLASYPGRCSCKVVSAFFLSGGLGRSDCLPFKAAGS